MSQQQPYVSNHTNGSSRLNGNVTERTEMAERMLLKWIGRQCRLNVVGWGRRLEMEHSRYRGSSSTTTNSVSHTKRNVIK